MPPRLSQHSLSKKGKPGKAAFEPNIKEWTKACEISAFDTQIIKYFSISKETFYSFIDKARYIADNGNKSEYLDAYINGRKKTKNMIAESFFNKIKDGDTSSVIFGMKSYNGALEAKDVYLIEMKKRELELKQKQFLTELANKFELNYEQLDEFAGKYFKESKLEDI